MNDFSGGVCIGFVRSDMLTVNKMFIHLVENAEISLKSVHRYSVDLWNESQSVVYLNGMHTNDLAVNNQQKVFFFSAVWGAPSPTPAHGLFSYVFIR